MKSKILLLGSTGMLGHVVNQYFIEQGYEVYCTSRNKEDKYYFDAIDNISNIENIIQLVKPNYIINCIGILNKVAEENHDIATLINSYLPHYLDKLSYKYNYKLLHVSTDCVFNGSKGEYTEDSFKDAQTFYGRSKGLGEITDGKNVTLRTSIIGPDSNPNGIGLFQWFVNQVGPVNGYSHVMWSGVTTLEFAKCMKTAIENNIIGLNHVVNNEKISKYDLLSLIKEIFQLDTVINDDPSIINDKSLIKTTKSYDFNVPSYRDMIIEMYEWIEKHECIYTKKQNKELIK